MPGPEEGECCNFLDAILHLGRRGNEEDGLEVQVDPRHGHEGVEDVVLVRHEEASCSIEGHRSPVILGVERREEVGGDGHDGEVLDVRVMCETVGRDVVHVVRPLQEREGCDEVRVSGSTHLCGQEIHVLWCYRCHGLL